MQINYINFYYLTKDLWTTEYSPFHIHISVLPIPCCDCEMKRTIEVRIHYFNSCLRLMWIVSHVNLQSYLSYYYIINVKYNINMRSRITSIQLIWASMADYHQHRSLSFLLKVCKIVFHSVRNNVRIRRDTSSEFIPQLAIYLKIIVVQGIIRIYCWSKTLCLHEQRDILFAWTVGTMSTKKRQNYLLDKMTFIYFTNFKVLLIYCVRPDWYISPHTLPLLLQKTSLLKSKVRKPRWIPN